MSKPNWVQEHIDLYRKNPQQGHLWDSTVVGGPGNVPCLLLTTTGHKSGKEGTTPLIYCEQEGGYVIIASKGGAPNHPSWYLNLAKNPTVQIQVAERILTAVAETVEGDRRTKLWNAMLEVWPAYDDYQKKTDRDIPVVLLQPKP